MRLVASCTSGATAAALAAATRFSATAQRFESTDSVKQIGLDVTTYRATHSDGAVWRLLLSPPATGADNMALDEALLLRARQSGEWTLRVYAWSVPTLSLGRNQVARDGYDLAALRRRGVDVVRRPTGGRAILHNREVTYSVTAPAEDAGDLRESYARINRLLVDGLRALGVPAVVVDATGRHGHEHHAHHRPDLLPCFDHPSLGEITLFGRKLVGSAQWRSNGALLQHGSILVDDDQMHIASLMAHPAPAAPASATLHQALGRAPTIDDVAEALFAAVRRLEDATASELTFDATLAECTRTIRCRYLDNRWTWRC